MADILGILLACVGLGLVAVMTIAQRRVLRRVAPSPAGRLPAVSVLKPLRGVDASLEANLETFFRQDHAAYEIVLGAADASDPALEVARRVAARHPDVRATVVADSRRVGENPKANNLANLARRARYPVLLVSDSNIAVPREYVRDLAARLVAPGVGLVSSVFRGTGGRGIGAALESIQLDTFVTGGVCAVGEFARGRACVVGKSMMLRRRDLGRVGGLPFLARYLAEDQVCGEEIAALGLRIETSGVVVDNVLGCVTLRGFAARHVRWCRIRRRMDGVAYALEPLANPVAVAALAWACGASAALPAAAWLVKSALDHCMESALGVHRPLLARPFLTAMHAAAVAVLWPCGFFGSTVLWRGNRLRIGGRTHLTASPAVAPRAVPRVARALPPLAAGVTSGPSLPRSLRGSSAPSRRAPRSRSS